MLTRKAILNITSRKKKDSMQPIAGEQSTGAPAPTVGPRQFLASDGSIMCLYRPTERLRDTFIGGNPPTVDDPAARTATEVFYRGLRENISISTSGSSAWRWRRICFTFKSDRFNFDPLNTTDRTRLNEFTSNGYMRAINAFNLTDPFQQVMYDIINAYVFQGTSGIDWNSTFLAKTDTERIQVKYDKTFIIRSGNDAGIVKDFKFWHPMNKTFVYDEDEQGGAQQNGSLSALTRRSMGDYYVMDIIGCNDDNAETLLFNPNSTLYWHER